MSNKKKVLFFDDELFISRVLAESLQLFGWDVTLVSEINELFKIIKSECYDIIILDIMAPIPEIENESIRFTKKEIDEMDNGINTGVVIAKKIWELKQEIPILFLSARRADTIVQLPKTRIFDYIRKSEQARIISDKLLELLKLN